MVTCLFSTLFLPFSSWIRFVITDQDPSALWPDFNLGG